ncbi:ribosomal RNA small subunit methyltransferase H [Pelagophyceae sp. CCMP2097]|nr:ribosomal RNA small subunit methyltransferase H [Pelagophyceae sp. CCMP2097]
MLKEVCEWLVTEKDGLYVDGTLGGGGHSAALLAALKNLGRVVGVDQDADAIATATARIASDRFRAVRSNFDGGIEAACGGELADGVLLDLGVSSHQLDAAARGFSLRFDGPLDMRMNAEASSLTAHDVVNTYEERALKDLIRAGSDEAHAGRIAKAIIAARPLERTTQLATVIAAAVPYKKKISPVADEMMRKKTVARVFQAIRIRVNDEFGALERTLLALPSFVKPGGRVVVLAYHSLEDRRVKRILRSGSLSGECPTDVFGNRLSPWKVIARGALTPSEAELERNGRARSVRMRVAERTDFVPNDDPNGRDMRIVAARIRTAMR